MRRRVIASWTRLPLALHRTSSKHWWIKNKPRPAVAPWSEGTCQISQKELSILRTLKHLAGSALLPWRTPFNRASWRPNFNSAWSCRQDTGSRRNSTSGASWRVDGVMKSDQRSANDPSRQRCFDPTHGTSAGDGLQQAMGFNRRCASTGRGGSKGHPSSAPPAAG